VPSAKINSGRVSWPRVPCTGDGEDGCEWQRDPVCLVSGGDLFPQPLRLTPAAAQQRCAAEPSCVGFTYDGLGNVTGTVPVMFKTRTDEVKGGGSGCWSSRKYYPLAHDPFRTSFHFQPSSRWHPLRPHADAKCIRTLMPNVCVVE
jgi:hypothetical protein